MALISDNVKHCAKERFVWQGLSSNMSTQNENVRCLRNLEMSAFDNKKNKKFQNLRLHVQGPKGEL